MNSVLTKELDAIRDMETVEGIKALAKTGCGPAARLQSNSHIHLPPNFSAFESVAQAVDLAAEQDVRVVGVTNYYDYRVYGDFAARAREKRIFPLFGLEVIALVDELARGGVKVNDPGNPGRYYFCGKGVMRIGDMPARAKDKLDWIRTNVAARMETMTRRIGEVFTERGLDLRLTSEDAIDMVARRHGSPRDSIYLQERHICQAYQEALFARVPAAERASLLERLFGAPSKAAPNDHVAIQGEIRSHLMKAGKPAYAPEKFVSFEEAYQLVLDLGGIPCYPTLADGTKPICPYEAPIATLIANLKARNIHIAEFIPIRNTPEVLAQYVKAMRAAGLAVVGGTEHNTLDLIALEPACLKGAPVPEEVKDIFWEGACVVAAHQFLTLHGECGFVNADGAPNPQYKSADERITAFARMGAAVIKKYLG
ncbi:MAG: hypothetical protein NTX50_14015 [Candidatus Sumerlaeota bacterium]|nr:hypothetical protein [Candidatus Sumerlaeota bacterium]